MLTTPKHSNARATTRLMVAVLVTLTMLVPVLGLGLLGRASRRNALRLYYRILLRVCGLCVGVQGCASRGTPVLYASNHVSYLDIVVLGSEVLASFVSKAEVRHWPAVGWLARQVGTIFIHRQVGQTRGQIEQLGTRLAQGDSLVLFPEGRSSDGTDLLPFKSALFAALSRAERPVVVQPVTLLYRCDVRGAPASAQYRARYAWFGDGPDSDFGGHAWRMLGTPGMHIQIVFHTPIDVGVEADRKVVARQCQQAVAIPLQQWRDAGLSTDAELSAVEGAE